MDSIYILWSLIVIGSLNVIQEVKSIRFCSFCDTTNKAVCKSSVRKCAKTDTKCDSSTTQKCEGKNDLCLASWRYSDQGLTILSRCFPLPPHSKRTDFSKNCKPWQRNGTYTCLCRRNGCNKYPIRQLVTRPDHYQATTSTMSNKETMSMLASVQGTNANSAGHGTVWGNVAKRWILVSSTATFVMIFILLLYCLRLKNSPYDTQEKNSVRNSDERSVAQKLPILESVISRGKSSTVWRGLFSGKNVAIKYFPPNAVLLWQNECSIFSKCSPGHENILKFIGASDASDNLNQMWLATSFHEQGSLQEYLTAHTLPRERLITMAKCITAGLCFLHSEMLLGEKTKPPIAHQDLKSKNILVGHNGICVLADFGLSLDLTEGYIRQVYRNGQVGTFRYMAPEKLEARIDMIENPESFKQIDIYALALVLWELLSRYQIADDACTDFALPFEDLVGCDPTLEQMTETVVSNGCRPSIPTGLSTVHTKDDTLKCLWTTIKECWDEDPEARLTAECVNTRLASLVGCSQTHCI